MDLTHPSARLIVSRCKSDGLLRNQAAYVLATAWHETGEFKWMREIWGPTPTQERYEGRADLGNTEPGDGKRFMGRGFVMITGRRNYTDWAKRLGVDIVAHPELVEQPFIAVQIIVLGMKLGTFTGKKLSDYITLQSSDFVNARRIINGTDKADLIASYAKQYDALLSADGYGVDAAQSAQPAPPAPVSPAPVQPQPAPAPSSSIPAPAPTKSAPAPHPIKHVGVGLAAGGLAAIIAAYWHDLVLWVHHIIPF